MNLKQILQLIYNKKWLLFWATILGAFLAFDLVVITPPQYQANSRVLVIQKNTEGQDIYSISKSAQYISKILKQSVYSDAFFEKAINSSYGFDKKVFPKDIKERRKKWRNSIEIYIERDLGIIDINTHHYDQKIAKQLNLAITDVLVKNHKFFHGADDDVEVKVLDYSLADNKPLMLNLWLMSILGAIVGFGFGLLWLLKKNK